MHVRTRTESNKKRSTWSKRYQTVACAAPRGEARESVMEQKLTEHL